MRAFLVVLTLGAVLFLAGGAPAALATARPRDAPEGEQAVREFLTIGRHFAASGGDPRFAERIPASPGVVEEMGSELAFARERLGVEERPELVRVERVKARLQTEDTAEVQTREFWIFRRRALRGEGSASSLPPVSAVVRVVYEVRRERARWIVLGYRLEAPEREREE